MDIVCLRNEHQRRLPQDAARHLKAAPRALMTPGDRPCTRSLEGTRLRIRD